jgi:ankyrin repeat protein
MCAKCFRKHNPEEFKKQKQEAQTKLYQDEAALPVAEMSVRQKMSQLAVAIARKNIARMDDLFQDGTCFIAEQPHKHTTWFVLAVEAECETAIFQQLLAAGCDSNATCQGGSTALDRAVGRNNLRAILWLLENGADPNLGRPIVAAIGGDKPAERQIEILDLLLKFGADINQPFDCFGDSENPFTVLDWANVYSIPSEVIQFLESKGARHKWTASKIKESKDELGHQRIVQ